MFSKNDCGTTLWFPEDEDDSIPLGKKRAFAIATFGTLRGGNLSLVTSNDGMQSWEDHGEFIFTRPDHWDNATLSSGQLLNWTKFSSLVFVVEDPRGK